MAIVIERRRGAVTRYVGLPLPKLPGKLREISQEALVDTVRHWRDKYGPLHFQTTAFFRYGGREDHVYTRRSNLRKGQTTRDPLVKTGRLRQAFLTGTIRFRSVGATTRTLKVTASWPNLPRHTYIDKHGRSRAQGPKKYRELTIINEQEEAQLTKYFEKRHGELLSQAEKGD